MKYDAFGPFKVPRHKNGLFTREPSAKREFWDDLEGRHEGLPDACGCYLLSVRNRVWYVGVSEKQIFRTECFSTDKANKIDHMIASGRGHVYLLLLARMTPNGRFAKPSKNGFKDAQKLELLLIGAALDRNENLLNKKDTKILREAVVPGFLNSPRGCGNDSAVKRFRKILGI
jgi:hypothetical protein